jgi:hypothetical protein
MSRVHTQSRPAARALPAFRIPDGISSNVTWRPLVAALLSIALPGLGHLFIGERRRGLTLIGITAALITVAVVFSPRDPFEALAMLTRPRNLAGLLVADVAIMAFRLYAVIDAYRRARPAITSRSRRSPVLLATMALLVAMTAAPHVAVGYYDLVTYQFLDRTFNRDAPPSQADAPTEVELTREVRLKEGVAPLAPPVVENTEE